MEAADNVVGCDYLCVVFSTFFFEGGGWGRGVRDRTVSLPDTFQIALLQLNFW